MNKYYKKTLAIVLSVAMAFCCTPGNIYGGEAAEGSTETIDVSEEDTVNAEVYFVQSATKKIITLDGNVDNPIDCKTLYDGETSVPNNGLFTIYYGKGTTDVSKDKTVVNFTNKDNKTSWKADNDKVFQMGKTTNPSGWESIMMEAQGDGTVSFKSCANGKYFSIEGETLKLVEIGEDEKTSTNEKFILYTKTAPKTAKKISLSNVSGDSVTVSWQGVEECLYSGYEVLYSTEEDGEYISAGYTADTTFDVTGLNLDTKYYFKVRTLTNNEGGVYADSKVTYAQTLKDYKPSKPTDVKVKQDGNKFVITWNKSNSSLKYKVYRAVSRFAEYTEIGEVQNTTFTDQTPNASSKYANYYKVQGVNNADIGELSEPGSLEIDMFGTETYIFNGTDDAKQISAATEEIYKSQHYNQFGNQRYLLAYKPGDYTKGDIVNMGYYTQTIGLGKVPNDVRLNNVKVPSALSGNNATCNFWVGIENLTIADTDDNDDAYYSFQWGASQASPARRLNIERKASFDWFSGWASGGFIADSYFHKAAGSYSQQQYYYRNCFINEGIYGVNWNQVIQGCDSTSTSNIADNTQLPINSNLINNNGITNWNNRGCTTVLNSTPEIREKPFLYFDQDADEYKVFIPALRKNSKGVSWSESNMGAGTSISVNKYFYIANPDTDTAATINKQIESGKNIIFQPGIYHVSEPIKVTKANTVLLGLGMATIIPDNNEAAITTADVGGISICGLILDSGNNSKTLLTVGKEGGNKNHTDNPTVLQDVIYRVGGTSHLGRCEQCLVINSNDVIIDHTWIWRADHGDNVGWTKNTSKNGLIVNGNDVTAYGLFCEHFQEYDIVWRGENGSTYFLQNEKCYDPQNQEEWMSHNGTKKGFAAYKVTNNVKNHYAVGLGVYDVFINTNGASIYLDNAIEVPNTKGVLIENACIVEIASDGGPKVGINHIINNTTAGIKTGAGSNGGYALQRLLSYNNEQSISLPDYYTNKESVQQEIQQGESPTTDSYAEKEIKKDTLSTDKETPLWEMTEKMYDDKIAQSQKGDNTNSSNNDVSDNKTQMSENVVLKAGQKIVLGKYTYRIKKVTGKTGSVALIAVNKKYKKNLKKAVVKSVIKYKNYSFKVTIIGKKAFAKCTKLTTITIGKNVKTINSKAFYYSKKIKKVTVNGSKLKVISKSAFNTKVRDKIRVKANKVVKSKIFKSLKRTK